MRYLGQFQKKYILMLRKLIKKAGALFLIGLIFIETGTPAAFFEVFKSIIEANKTTNIVDKIYLAKKNSNVVDSFSSHTDKVYAAVNPAENEYMVDVGPVNGSTAANYVFVSFFNPVGSGRTASIKRIALRSNTASSTASNYVNLTVRRITAASAGTQILASNFPKKNASSTDSVMDVRYAGVTATFAGTIDSRILGVPLSGAVGAYYSNRDLTFDTNDEKLVLQPGEGIAVYQEAAGAAPTKVRLLVEWDETANAPPSGGEYIFAFPRVENAAAANYVYNSFFNPAASGKTAVVKRIWLGTETCDAAAVYTNSISLRRISAASAGTAVAATNIPKKNTSSADSVMDVRHTGVTVTQVGTTDAKIAHIIPCGAAGQAGGWQRIDFTSSDEKLVLQAGEGVALISEAAGNANQLTRMIVEWDEVTSANTPASQGEYFFTSGKVASSTVVNTTLFSFFNPAASGKTAVIKRIAIMANATTTGAYSSLQWRRTSAASGGSLIAASDLPKLHTGTANSVMEMRWCLQGCTSAITATYAGTADSRILGVTAPGAVGQTIGQNELIFSPNEKLILQPGEGIGLYNDVLTSSLGDSIRVMIEWDEETVTPTAQGEYIMSIGPINGSTATTYNYISFFNPVSSGKTAVIKRARIRVDTIAAAVYVPIQLRRITASSAGTVIASSSYPKKNSSSATSVMEIRTTGNTVTYAGATTSRYMLIQTPGAVASAASGNTGYRDMDFSNSESIVLKPGEGVTLYQTPTAGNANLRVRLMLEWSEVASTPTALGEYMFANGPINQSLVANYVYATIFNPITSAKNFIVHKFGMQADRSGAATNPTYTPATVRRITAASGGILVATTSIQKNTGSAATAAEIRSTGVTATFAGVTESRLLGGTTPGVVNQVFADYETSVTPGDELVLKPGEGLALYQEQANGDANSRYNLFAEWSEESTAAQQQSITFSVSTSAIYFGQVSSLLARYASSTNTAGSDVETEAHTISVVTNAVNGYTVSVQGQTLNTGTDSIAAIGGTATTSNIGTEQFGLRVTAVGGSGTTTAPYNTTGFAYAATASSSDQIASSSVGDNATTTFGIRYVANIAGVTKAGTYTANLVYIATANF